MAQYEPPNDIVTQPASKIVFNAPYDDKHTYHIKADHQCWWPSYWWAIKTAAMGRLGIYPQNGVLDRKEAVLVDVTCDPFEYGQEDTNNDRITIEWTNTPVGAAKQFSYVWFDKSSNHKIRCKDLKIECNC